MTQKHNHQHRVWIIDTVKGRKNQRGVIATVQSFLKLIFPFYSSYTTAVGLGLTLLCGKEWPFLDVKTVIN